jgi:hypothetical protein
MSFLWLGLVAFQWVHPGHCALRWQMLDRGVAFSLPSTPVKAIPLTSYRFAALIFIVVAASGCKGIPTVLPPEARSQVNNTAVRSYVPQAEVNFEFMPSSYGAGLGLIGAIVDVSVNASMAGSAEGRAKRLRAEVADYDFRTHYWQAVTNKIAEPPWLKVQTIETLPVQLPKMKSAMVTNGSVLNVGTGYAITPNCRVLRINTGYDFYVPGKHKKPAASVLLSYYSSEIGTEEGDKALALWMNDRGGAYRRAMEEGIAESAKLTRHALDLMGGSYSGTPKPAKVRAKLVHGRGEFGIPVGKAGLKGVVLEESPERVVFQVAQGSIFSFPRKEIEVEFLPAK